MRRNQNSVKNDESTQSAFTYSKLTIQMSMSNFTPCPSVSIVNFEHVNADWIFCYIGTGDEGYENTNVRNIRILLQGHCYHI